MTPLLLLLGLAAAAGDIVGGAIVAAPRRIGERTLGLLMALGAGNLLGVSLVELVPESLDALGSAGPLLILAGYLLIHFFEHVFAPHLHFGEETHDRLVGARAANSAFLGLALHAFMDGVAITSAFVVSPGLGVLVFFAIMLHKLPEGFTVASVMKAAGRARRWALGTSALLALATFAGVLATGVVAEDFAAQALALATGSVLYVGATDLMAEANRAEDGLWNPFMVLVGIAMFFAVLALARAVGVEV